MARTLASWSEASLRPTDPPLYSYAIALGCLDYLGSVLRFDVPGGTLRDRVPEEEFEERAQLADWLVAIARRAQDHYVDSKDADDAAVKSLEENSENVVRFRREAG